MHPVIIASLQDPAGAGMLRALILRSAPHTLKFENSPTHTLRAVPHTYLVQADEKIVYAQDIEERLRAAKIPYDTIIFATRHQSAAGIPSLSVHVTGNWAGAELGGLPQTLSVAPADLLKHALCTLQNEYDRKHAADPTFSFEIIQEVTHHGPCTTCPSMFIEIGSSMEQWTREDAAEFMADVIVKIVTTPIPSCEPAIALGGLHHMPSFKKIMLTSEYSIGHAAPKHQLAKLDRTLITQALEKTITADGRHAKTVILDWKGLGGEKEHIKSVLEGMRIAGEPVIVKRTKEFSENTPDEDAS